VRVELPAHLRTLAGIVGSHEVRIQAVAPPTVRTVLDALEATYPCCAAPSATRSHSTPRFLRFFACQQDLSLDPPDAPLPDTIASGAEPLIVLGAVAGGLADCKELFCGS